jgi:DNA-binding transcriptional LysR family regulator
MQPLRQQGVPISEHEQSRLGSGSSPDWETVRVFLEVARRGSFRSAAEHLGISINALRRRIDDLEQQLGITVFTRHVDGVRMTTEGEQILGAAQRMEDASFGLIRARDRVVPAISGEVRLGVTEGLGTFWLAPRLVEFQRTYPRILVDLRCAMQSVDVMRLEADAAVQLVKPTAPDLKVVKLGRLHAVLFGAQTYLDTYGMPKTVEDLLKHRIVLQIADQTSGQEAYDQVFPGARQPGFVAIRTNVSSANLWAISKGAGIGWVPTYAHALGARIVPIDIDARFSFDIWLTYHPDAGRIARVRRLIDWVIESFDAKQFPWFRDEFIHPNDLPREYRGEPLVNWFEGFSGRSDDTFANEELVNAK